MDCIDVDVLVGIREAIELDPSAGHAWGLSESLLTGTRGLTSINEVRECVASIQSAVGWLPAPNEPTLSALAAELMLLPRLALALEALGRLRGDIDAGNIPGRIGLRRAVHGLDKAIRAVVEANVWGEHVGPDFLGRIAGRLQEVVGPRSDRILSLAAAWRMDLDLPHHPRGDRLADLADKRGVRPAEGIDPRLALETLELEYDRTRKLPAFGPSWPTVPHDLADEMEGHYRAIGGFLDDWAAVILAGARKVSPEEVRAQFAAQAVATEFEADNPPRACPRPGDARPDRRDRRCKQEDDGAEEDERPHARSHDRGGRRQGRQVGLEGRSAFCREGVQPAVTPGVPSPETQGVGQRLRT